MGISLRSIITAGISTVTATALVFAPSVQPPPPPERTIQLASAVQPLAPQEPLLSVLLTSPLRLLGPAVTPGTLPPAPAPLAIPIAPNLANTIDNTYLAVEPWVQYGFEVATAVVRWIPYVGWFAGQIMVFYTFGEGIVASGVFNFTDWLRGDGGVVENLVDFGVDVGLAFVWLGLDELAQFVPLPPFCCYPPRPPLQGPFLALEQVDTVMGPTPPPLASILMPVGAITDALVDANETFFEVVSGVTELGLFEVATPTLEELGLDVAVKQIDLNYNHLLKPATIQEVEGISELLTVPRNYLNDVLKEGGDPLEALGAQAESVAGTVVTRVSNAADVVEKYVDKQLGNLPTPGRTADVTSVPASARTALKAVNKDSNEGGDDAAATTTKATKDTERVVKSLADAPRKVAKGIVQAQGQVRGAVADAAAAVRKAAQDAKDTSDKKSSTNDDTAKTSASTGNDAGAKTDNKPDKDDAGEN